MYLDSSLICLSLSSSQDRNSTVFDVGVRSDNGRVRENNEDSLSIAPECGLFVLSDGMGGLARGEVASHLTVSAIVSHCRQADSDPRVPLTGRSLAGVSEVSNRLVSAVQLANRIVYRTARESATPGEMGATVVAVRCVDGRMSVAHVGDSRVYRLRGRRLDRLTQDHSLAAEQARLKNVSEEEAGVGPYHNVLTRAVGIDAEVAVDLAEEDVRNGDIVLLCSDGLTNELSDWQIASILQNAKSSQAAADELVSLANEAGGGDNVSVVIVRPLPQTGWPLARRLRGWFQASKQQAEGR